MTVTGDVITVQSPDVADNLHKVSATLKEICLFLSEYAAWRHSPNLLPQEHFLPGHTLTNKTFNTE